MPTATSSSVKNRRGGGAAAAAPRSASPLNVKMMSSNSNSNLPLGVDLEQDLDSAHKSARSKPRRRRKQQLPSCLDILAGVCFSILLLVFIAFLDFKHESSGRPAVAEDQPQGGNRGPATVDKLHPKNSKPAVQEISSALDRLIDCQFDGSCPVRSTCAVAEDGDGGGTCEPLVSQGPRQATSALTSCLDSCLKELQKDEHFYQEAWPVLDWSETLKSQGRPDGCLLVYHREADRPYLWKHLDDVDKEKTGDEAQDLPAPSVVDWTIERFRHLKRVDPYNDNMSDNKWIAYCTNPCQTDGDCKTNHDPSDHSSGFVCVKGSCQRNPKYWNKEQQLRHQMVIVSGATNNHFSGLRNLAASVRYWAPHNKMVIYNLGDLDRDQMFEIEQWSNVMSLEWKKGIPKQYPHHVQETTLYAWKPIIVNETLHKYGSIFWLDAGVSLTGPLDPIEQIVQNQGIMLVKGQDLDMKERSHAGTYKWFGFDKDSMKVGPHFAGGIQAHLYPSRYTEAVVHQNAKCALDENCIHPEGSSFGNHRFDQTTLSILAYSPKLRLPHYTEYLGARKYQMNEDLTKPSFRLIWSARQRCKFYYEREIERQKHNLEMIDHLLHEKNGEVHGWVPG